MLRHPTTAVPCTPSARPRRTLPQRSHAADPASTKQDLGYTGHGSSPLVIVGLGHRVDGEASFCDPRREVIEFREGVHVHRAVDGGGHPTKLLISRMWFDPGS